MTVIDYQRRGQEPVKELRSTQAYDDFEARLKDKVGKARIQHAYRDWPSNPGRCRHLERGVSELK